MTKKHRFNFSPYRKTVTAVVASAIGWATAVVASEPQAITASEWIFAATGLATSLGVFAVANSKQ